MRMQLAYDGERTPGIELLERLLSTGERFDGDLSPTDAGDALEGLEHLDLPWLVGGMVEGGEQFARQVHAEMGRGLQEVVQNAQDQGAEKIRFGFRTRERRNELLIAHDGDPVALHDVVFMAYPLLSGSRSDPNRIGRFGIGLKTLNQLGDKLAVHCPPFSFEIRDGRVIRARPARRIKSFWDPDARETLFVLRLAEGLDVGFFREWFRRWEAESLLFLRLRRLTFVDLRSRKTSVDHQLIEERRLQVGLDLPGGEGTERLTMKDPKTGRRWDRYTVHYPTPRRLREMKGLDKPFGATVPLSIAVPQRITRSGRLYAGLPLEEPYSLPTSASAPFLVNVDRTALRQDRQEVNEWLIDRLAEVLAAVALQRFGERPASTWRAVPLADEGIGHPASRLREHADRALERCRARIRSRLRLPLGEGATAGIDDIIFEDSNLEGIISELDQERLRPGKYPLPSRAKDAGRWREALLSLGAKDPIGLPDAVALLEQDEDVTIRGAKWLCRLAAAAIDSGAGELLARVRWILLADGSRVSPAELQAAGMLLVQRIDPSSLGGRLSAARPISPGFLSGDAAAKKVRGWLIERGNLRAVATDADALRALARGKGEAPVDLSHQDELLLMMRNAFDALGREERDNLGLGIGHNVLLLARHYDSNGRAHELAVSPTIAYLPSAIDKNEGWSTAAARTPDIYWLDRKYAEILRGQRRAQLGALAFLRKIGSEVTPRLESGPEASRDIAFLDPPSLPAQQRAELEDYPRTQILLDDWMSPDLSRVVDSIVAERSATTRRRRARALFVVVNRNWQEAYSERSQAVPAYYHRVWQRHPPVSATWVAHLASEPWLTTQEKGSHPRAPRDLRILTGAAYGLAGEDARLYVEELGEEFADTPLAEALGVSGRPRASEVIDLLEDLRDDDLTTQNVDSRRVQRCYEALARYCPGGVDQERSDLTSRQIKAAFSARLRHPGLIQYDHKWLTSATVRRGDVLSERLPTVHGAPELWQLLDIDEPNLSDCVTLLQELSDEGVEERATQVRVYRRIIHLAGAERRLRVKLASAPYYTSQGWLSGSRAYAVANPALAEALAVKLPVWNPPLAFEELGPLLEYLNVEVVEEASAHAVIDPVSFVAGDTVRQDMPSAVQHFKNTLVLYHDDLYSRIADEDWLALDSLRLALGTKWTIRVRLQSQRTVTVSPRAFLFRQPLVFCALDEDEIGEMDSGGQAIASFFTSAGLSEHDRAFIAMAWERAFRQRQETSEPLTRSPDPVEDEPAAGFPLPRRRQRLGKRRGRSHPKVAGNSQGAEQPAERELLDPSEIDLSTLDVLMIDSKRRGQLRPLTRRPLRKPDGKSSPPRSAAGSPGRPHIAKERERVGYELMDDYLSAAYALRLIDYRDRTDIGADGVDEKKDIWIELKAHAGAAPDSVKLTASEAERAKEKKERYWLVVASGLEKGQVPALVILPDPLRRLDIYIGGGIRLVGIQEEQVQMKRR